MDEKSWYMSKTVWASLIVVIVAVLGIMGKSQEAGIVQTESGGIANWIVQLLTLIAGAVAFYGRLTAKKTLTK